MVGLSGAQVVVGVGSTANVVDLEVGLDFVGGSRKRGDLDVLLGVSASNEGNVGGLESHVVSVQSQDDVGTRSNANLDLNVGLDLHLVARVVEDEHSRNDVDGGSGSERDLVGLVVAVLSSVQGDGVQGRGDGLDLSWDGWSGINDGGSVGNSSELSGGAASSEDELGWRVHDLSGRGGEGKDERLSGGRADGDLLGLRSHSDAEGRHSGEVDVVGDASVGVGSGHSESGGTSSVDEERNNSSSDLSSGHAEAGGSGVGIEVQ